MPDPEDLSFLLEAGVRAVVSLTLRDPFAGEAVPEELSRLRLPIPDMTAPDEETVGLAIGFIDRSLEAGRPVLVHCGAGYGRTGTILACYLVHRGASGEEAIRRVRERRPGSIETRSQEETILRYDPGR
jgi:atypical dual specificity phosphatase